MTCIDYFIDIDPKITTVMKADKTESNKGDLISRRLYR